MADPKKGTGKKPKGSGRRLYTDENPKDMLVKTDSWYKICNTSKQMQERLLIIYLQKLKKYLNRLLEKFKS